MLTLFATISSTFQTFISEILGASSVDPSSEFTKKVKKELNLYTNRGFSNSIKEFSKPNS